MREGLPPAPPDRLSSDWWAAVHQCIHDSLSITTDRGGVRWSWRSPHEYRWLLIMSPLSSLITGGILCEKLPTSATLSTCSDIHRPSVLIIKKTCIYYKIYGHCCRISLYGVAQSTLPLHTVKQGMSLHNSLTYVKRTHFWYTWGQWDPTNTFCICDRVMWLHMAVTIWFQMTEMFNL